VKSSTSVFAYVTHQALDSTNPKKATCAVKGVPRGATAEGWMEANVTVLTQGLCCGYFVCVKHLAYCKSGGNWET